MNKGDGKYNGGTKLYNLFVKLLRAHGYEAYIATYDGKYEHWLIEHQPHVSLETVREWKVEGRPLRFVTAWMGSNAFIDLADEIYFYDVELAWTSGTHFAILRSLMDAKKIRSLATHSRTQQAWYLATFRQEPILIPEWSDETYWFPLPEKRQLGTAGYLIEGPRTRGDIRVIAEYCHAKGVDLQLLNLAGGDECAIIEKMRQCDFYLGMNPGKSAIWGEGCPRTQQEAMHAGCVVIAYDVRGNREYLIDGYTGILVKRHRPDLVAQHLVRLMQNFKLKEQIRATSTDLAARAFSSYGRWELVREFLEI
jgi:hypothetical protein